MTIASALTALNTDIQNARTAITNKGGTVTSGGGSSQLATDIATIPSGGGFYQIPSYEVNNGIATKINYTLTGNEFDGITSVNVGFQYAFYFCHLGGILKFKDLQTVTGYGFQHAFQGNNFTSCEFNVQSLDNLSFQLAFAQNSYLQTASFPNLSSMGMSEFQQAFFLCTAITDIYFNSLTTSSFGSYTNQFNNMMGSTGTDVTHTIHFPSNMQSTIEGLTGYPTFGGTSGYVTLAFDLPATS